MNIFYGANGVGKTNLLEALSLLSPGRGLRRATVEEMTRREGDTVAPAWGVTANLIEVDADTSRLSVGQNPQSPSRRILRLNSTNTTSTAFAERLTLMWLTPAQDRLFTGPAADRRKFLDRFSLAHTPDHGQTVARYEKLRAERNRLLGEQSTDPAWYRAIESDLAHYGARISAARMTTVELLREEIASRPDGAFPKSTLSLDSLAADLFRDGASLDDVQAMLVDRLAQTRPDDLRRGRTQIGPHQSDLQVTHAPKCMPASHCSTGEQKALLIGLVLAHARSHPTRTPILLLDEIAAHLDDIRRRALATELADLGSQVFLTGTDHHLFSAFESAHLFEVRDGDIIAQK